jgi:bifunctional DNA-binding transcriptional regulator/antitoxin component of YhaV-PrlF toxin-antitoxin module
MRPVVVKVTSKNQITLPDALMRELGRPSHFKAFVQEGNLVLFSARLATVR